MKLRKWDFLIFYIISVVILLMNLMGPIIFADIVRVLSSSVLPALILGSITSLFFSSKRKLLLLCSVLIVLSVLTYGIDARLVAQDKKPIFVVSTAAALDGGTTIYKGLGYKVIGWNRLTAKQIDGKEVNGIMKGYEISTIFHPQDINKGPRKELKFIANRE